MLETRKQKSLSVHSTAYEMSDSAGQYVCQFVKV